MPVRSLQARQAMASDFAARYGWGAGFTADPGSSGSSSNELSGGSPAYARAAITWAAPDSTAKLVGTCTINQPAGTAVPYQSPCSAQTGGLVADAQAVTGTAQTASAQTTNTLTFVYQF